MPILWFSTGNTFDNELTIYSIQGCSRLIFKATEMLRYAKSNITGTPSLSQLFNISSKFSGTVQESEKGILIKSASPSLISSSSNQANLAEGYQRAFII